MAREDYNACMVPWIKGKDGLERRMSFCVGAKICSGKAKTEEEAVKICTDRFSKKKGEGWNLPIDNIKVKVDGKNVLISADLINKLCACGGK